MPDQLAGLKAVSVAFYLGGFIAAPIAFFAWGPCIALSTLLLFQMLGAEIRAEVLAMKGRTDAT